MLTDEKINELMSGYELPMDVDQLMDFARTIKRAVIEQMKRPAPCEHLCEARAFEIEIRQLKAAVEQSDDKLGMVEQLKRPIDPAILAKIRGQAVRDFGEEIGLFDSAYDDQEYIEVSRYKLREHVDSLLSPAAQQEAYAHERLSLGTTCNSDYVKGWNDCIDVMLAAAPSPPDKQ